MSKIFPVTLPDQLHAELKRAAALSGVSMSAYVVAAINQSLNTSLADRVEQMSKDLARLAVELNHKPVGDSTDDYSDLV